MRSALLFVLAILSPALALTEPPKRPATAAADSRADIKALQERIDGLAKRIDRLERENAALAAAIAARPEVKADPRTATQEDDAQRIGRAFNARKLAIGMTYEQVKSLAGGEGRMTSESAGGKDYRWELPNDLNLTEGAGGESGNHYFLYVHFRDGKVTGWSKS